MITKSQLRELVDANNRFKHSIEVPWEQTSLSRLYDILDSSIQGGSLVDIVSAKPYSFDQARETLMVELLLDCSDILESSGEEE